MTQEPWLLVGLGNPGRKYEKTWHNLGCMALEVLCQRHGWRVDRIRFQGLTGQALFAGQRLILLKPMTYMNLSGRSVREAASFYKIPAARCLILVDDLDLPLGLIRIREYGGAGTHNGLKSVISELGTEDFPRIRIGMGPKPEVFDLAAYVLSEIPQQAQETAFSGLNKAADAVELILKDSITLAMSRLNGQ